MKCDTSSRLRKFDTLLGTLQSRRMNGDGLASISNTERPKECHGPGFPLPLRKGCVNESRAKDSPLPRLLKILSAVT